MSTAKIIWGYLTGHGLTAAGTAGLMGNLYYESGLKPDRVELLCLKRLAEAGYTYTDETYTKAVDICTIDRDSFLHPLPGKVYGYGLAQWTTPGRKAGLYDLCKARGVSIGDLDTQLEYLVSELKQSFPAVWDLLAVTDTVRIASDTVLLCYEMPADTSEAVRRQRADKAYSYYYQYTEGDEEHMAKGVTAEEIVNIMRSWLGYSESNGRHKQIIDIYNSHTPLARGYRMTYTDSWCDATVSAAFIKAGAVDIIGGTECGVQEHINLFKKAGIWVEDGTVLPKPGYIVCYNWDTASQPNNGYADHIGIVEQVTSSNVIVIEGNMGHAVGRRSMPVGWGYIRGYAVPKYMTAAVSVSAGKTQTRAQATAAASQEGLSGPITVSLKWFLKGASDPQIKTIQMLLSDKGYKGRDGKALIVDGVLGDNTAYAIERFQRDKGFPSSTNWGTVAGKTWKALIEG